MKAKQKTIAKIDLKDRKILYQLDINARQRSSKIGKKVGVSKQVVIYRINKLIKTGVIEKFYAVYDTAKLGYTTYKIFLRLQKVDIDKQNEIIEYIKNSQNVQFFMSCDGNFDIVFNVLVKSALELYDILKELENKYGEYIAEREFIIMVFSSFFFRDYLIGKSTKEIRKTIYFGSKSEETEVDEINKKILCYLGINARMPITEIANAIDISPDTVALRIKKLEKAQIIQNYQLLPNFFLLNQISYKILFSLHNSTAEKEIAFHTYCSMHQNIWFHSKSLGRWDLEINMDVENANQFRTIMMEAREKFSDIIKEYVTLSVSKVHKFNFYPLKVL